MMEHGLVDRVVVAFLDDGSVQVLDKQNCVFYGQQGRLGSCCCLPSLVFTHLEKCWGSQRMNRCHIDS
jgi:hypothetical protein